MQAAFEYFNLGWIYSVLLVAYAVTIVAVVGIVLSENRNPLKSLAWVTVLILLPVGGLVLYIFFGRSIKNTRIISRRKSQRLLRNEAQHHSLLPQAGELLPPEARVMATLGHSLTGATVWPGNHIELFSSGAEMFERLMADVESASVYINLQYYIIEDDTTGRRLGDTLMAKARAGVKVRIIYDDIGSIHLSRRYLKQLRASGVEAYPFSRVAFPPFATRINWRNHRKVSVIDGRVGYIGGMNIADRYIDGGRDFAGWRDCHLRVQGPGVSPLQHSFAVDWSFMRRTLLEEPAGAPLPPGIEVNADIQMINSGPTSRWSNVAMMFLRAISQARERIFIQTPYFLPTESLLRSLQTAALAHVDVRVMMPTRSDSRVLTWASRSFIDECLRAGIKIYLYDGGMLHSKMMVIDDEISTVGSTNFDFRSFEHNFEANFFIYSRQVNAQLARRFALDQEDSHRIHIARWKRRPWLQKTKESIFRLLSPVL